MLWEKLPFGRMNKGLKRQGGWQELLTEHTYSSLAMGWASRNSSTPYSDSHRKEPHLQSQSGFAGTTRSGATPP